jgi:hypothetical protein
MKIKTPLVVALCMLLVLGMTPMVLGATVDGSGTQRTVILTNGAVNVTVDIPETIYQSENASFEIVTTDFVGTHFHFNYTVNDTVVKTVTISANGTSYANFTDDGTAWYNGSIVNVNVTLYTASWVFIDDYNTTMEAQTHTAQTMNEVTEAIIGIAMIMVVLMVVFKAISSITKSIGGKKK